MDKETIYIYTDGSCHPQTGIGGWASLIFIPGNKEPAKPEGTEVNTNQHRMEIKAVLEAMEFIKHQGLLNQPLVLITDSQYVSGLLRRVPTLRAKNFLTKKGVPVANSDLVKEIIPWLEMANLTIREVKGHNPSAYADENMCYVDKRSRKLVREKVSSS